MIKRLHLKQKKLRIQMFIYHFIQEFSYDIREIDIKSNDTERNFRILFYQGFNTPRQTEIYFNVYFGELTYKLTINDKSQLGLTYKIESRFIEDNR